MAGDSDEYLDDDDNRVDVYALFILDSDIPHSMINEVLTINAAQAGDVHSLWPASTYNQLPRFRTWPPPEVPKPPIHSNWTSPFIGKTLQQVAGFVKNAPKPLCRTFFAVVEKERYEREGLVRVCKIVDDGEGDGGVGCVQSFCYDGDEVTVYFVGHDRDTWEQTWSIFRDGAEEEDE